MPSKINLALGVLIAFIRQSTGITQSKCAVAMGVSQATIASLEVGESLTVKNLEKISTFFEIPISSLMKASENLLAIFENENEFIPLACYLIGAIDACDEDLNAASIIKHISNYHQGVIVHNTRTPGLARALVGIGNAILSMQEKHQSSTS